MSFVTDSEDTEDESDISSTYSSDGNIPLASIKYYRCTNLEGRTESTLSSAIQERQESADSESDESNISSSYTSDGAIACCNIIQHVSGWNLGEQEIAHPLFISSLTDTDQKNLAKLSTCGIEDLSCICPSDVQNCLPTPIRDKLFHMADDTRALVYVKSPAMTFGWNKEDNTVPVEVICDLFIFPQNSSVKILTFVTEITGSTKYYNSVLAKNLTKMVSKNVIMNFHLEHGVIGQESWKCLDSFKEALLVIKQKAIDTALPRSLEMTKEIQTSIIRGFLHGMIDGQHMSSAYMDMFSQFVVTPAYKKVRCKLQQESILIVTGGNVDERATLGQRLCYDYHQEGYQTVFYNREEDINWDVLKGKDQTLVVINALDFFPSAPWTSLQSKNDNVKVVIIAQSHNLEGVQKHYHGKVVLVNITQIRNQNLSRAKLECNFLYLAAADVSLCNKHLEDPNVTQEDINRALTNCIWLNDLQAFLYLRDMLRHVQRKDLCYNADCTDVHGNTLLMIAVERNNEQFVDTLESDGDLLMKNQDGNTAFHIACFKGFIEICKSLLCVMNSQKDLLGQDLMTPIMMTALAAHGGLFDYLADVEKCELTRFDENGNTVLHLACAGGNLHIVKSLISRRKPALDLNQRGQYGRTPIMIAAHYRHRVLFEWLLQQKCDISPEDFIMKDSILYRNIDNFSSLPMFFQEREYGIKGKCSRSDRVIAANNLKGHLENKITTLSFVDKIGMNLLHWAAQVGHVELAAALVINENADINSKDSSGRTPIMLAAASGHRHMFNFLRKREADLVLKDENYTGLLHFACQGGNPSVVNEVLHHELSDVNGKDNFGKTPVSYAVENGDVCIVEVLLSKGGDVSVEDMHKNTLLHLACKKGKLAMERYLLSTGHFDVNAVNENNRTPLLEAAYIDLTEACQDLIHAGTDLHIQDCSGNDVLLVASIKGNAMNTTSILAKYKNKEYLKDKSGQTAIMKAAKGGYEEVYFVLRQGIGFISSDTDNNGANILHNACSGHSVHIVWDIISQNFVDINGRDKRKRTAVTESAEKGHSEAFELLVKNGCDLSAVDRENRSVLHFACIGGSVDIVKTILSKYPALLNSKDKLDRTPVMEAAERGHVTVFGLLVGRGCSISDSDYRENNVLHYACRGGNKVVVKAVLSLNPFALDSRDIGGRTPVMWATQRGHKEVFDLLLEHGCDLSIISNDGYNILHCACYGGNADIVQYILSQNIVDIKTRDYNRRTPLMIAQYKEHSEIVALFTRRSGC